MRRRRQRKWEPISDLDHVLRPGVDQRRFVRRLTGECKPWVFVQCAPGITIRRWLDNLNPINWEWRKPVERTSSSASGNCGTCVKLKKRARKLAHENFALRLEKQQLEAKVSSNLPLEKKAKQAVAFCGEAEEAVWLIFDNARKVLTDERAAFRLAVQTLQSTKEPPCGC